MKKYTTYELDHKEVCNALDLWCLKNVGVHKKDLTREKAEQIVQDTGLTPEEAVRALFDDMNISPKSLKVNVDDEMNYTAVAVVDF